MPTKQISLPPSRLRERTHYLLCNRPETLPLATIARVTGVTPQWLSTFESTGLTCSASVDRIEALYEFLAGRKLTIH